MFREGGGERWSHVVELWHCRGHRTVVPLVIIMVRVLKVFLLVIGRP